MGNTCSRKDVDHVSIKIVKQQEGHANSRPVITLTADSSTSMKPVYALGVQTCPDHHPKMDSHDSTAAAKQCIRRPFAVLGSCKRNAGSPSRPDITAALVAAQQEVKAGAKLKLHELYRMDRVLGTGHHARVHLASSRRDGEQYAVKIIKKPDSRKDRRLQLQSLVTEVAVMRMLSDHPNTVQLHQVLQDDRHIYLIMEYCSGGDLFDHVYHKGCLAEGAAACAMQQLISFVAHAHSKHIIHRDLKAENILLRRPVSSSDGPDGFLLKIIDYGYSTFCEPDTQLSKPCGTSHYVAPEVLKCCYGLQADIWSAGVVLHLLLADELPFDGNNNEEILAQVLTGHFEMLPSSWGHVSAAAQELVKCMLRVDAAARPTAAALLKHPWLQQADSAAAGT